MKTRRQCVRRIYFHFCAIGAYINLKFIGFNAAVHYVAYSNTYPQCEIIEMWIEANIEKAMWPCNHSNCVHPCRTAWTRFNLCLFSIGCVCAPLCLYLPFDWIIRIWNASLSDRGSTRSFVLKIIVSHTSLPAYAHQLCVCVLSDFSSTPSRLMRPDTLALQSTQCHGFVWSIRFPSHRKLPTKSLVRITCDVTELLQADMMNDIECGIDAINSRHKGGHALIFTITVNSESATPNRPLQNRNKFRHKEHSWATCAAVSLSAVVSVLNLINTTKEFALDLLCLLAMIVSMLFRMELFRSAHLWPSPTICSPKTKILTRSHQNRGWQLTNMLDTRAGDCDRPSRCFNCHLTQALKSHVALKSSLRRMINWMGRGSSQARSRRRAARQRPGRGAVCEHTYMLRYILCIMKW